MMALNCDRTCTRPTTPPQRVRVQRGSTGMKDHAPVCAGEPDEGDERDKRDDGRSRLTNVRVRVTTERGQGRACEEEGGLNWAPVRYAGGECGIACSTQEAGGPAGAVSRKWAGGRGLQMQAMGTL